MADKFDRAISKARKEMGEAFYRNFWNSINWNNHPKHKAECLCGCGKTFEQKNKYHQFYSRRCYSRFHRLPGFVKRLVDHKD